MDGDLRLWPQWPTVTGDMLLRPAHPISPLPHYISLDQIKAFAGAGGGGGTVDTSYTLLVPTSGQTLSLPSGKVILDPAAPLSSLTLTAPSGTDELTIRLASRQRIDALTITGNVDWVVGELPQGGVLDFTYVASLGRWVRA